MTGMLSAIWRSTPELPVCRAMRFCPDSYGAPEGLAAEEYYDRLVPPFDSGNLDGSGYGDGERSQRGAAGEGRSSDVEITLDSHTLWEDADSTPLALAEEAVRAITRDSLRTVAPALGPRISWPRGSPRSWWR